MENLLECKICLLDYSSQIPERIPRLLSCKFVLSYKMQSSFVMFKSFISYYR